MAKKDETKPAAAARPARGAAAAKPEPAAEPAANEFLTRLQDAADNLNSVLGLEPAINAELAEEELKSAISAEAKLIGVDAKTDKVTEAVIAADKKALKPETWALLEEMGWLGHIKPAKEEKPARGAAAAKSDAKAATPAKTGAAAKPAKAAEAPRYTRANAFADAVDTGEKNIDKLIELSDANYVSKAGKTSNLKEAKWYYNTIVPGLIALGFATVQGVNITIFEAKK